MMSAIICKVRIKQKTEGLAYFEKKQRINQLWNFFICFQKIKALIKNFVDKKQKTNRPLIKTSNITLATNRVQEFKLDVTENKE